MEKTKSFKELIVWQKAHALVLKIYELSKQFTREELYGLTSQFRRAAVSIPANIAEGYKKKTAAAKINHLNIAEGSLEEVKYYFILSADLQYIPREEGAAFWNAAEEVGRLLTGYSNGIKNNT